MSLITIDEITQGTIAGTGVFDTLMRATKAHLEAEYTAGRIRGPEYATVYLGSMEAAMKHSLEFLVQRAQIVLLDKQALQAVQTTSNLSLTALNIPKEGEVLTAQKCKLQAEYDLLLTDNLKAAQETALLTQKVVTEKAQTTSMGVDDNSIIGKQKTLYGAQADGFKRDAEQKAAKILVDTWNVQRTTNDATAAIISDGSINTAVNKMIAGIS